MICPECDGKGNNEIDGRTFECSFCHATGHTCDVCGGPCAEVGEDICPECLALKEGREP